MMASSLYLLFFVRATIGAEPEASPPPSPQAASPEPEPIPIGIPNAYQVSPRIYCGAEPRGERAFEELKHLGIRTILSVDGARPDVDAAKAQGLRYVHLPIGYGELDREKTLRIAKAVQDLPGPVFIHCHHGKHRGPTAAAIAAMSTAGWNAEQSVRWMRAAGTSQAYRGLYQSVATFRPPTSAELKRVSDDFPSVSPPSALVNSMLTIDERWGNLSAFYDQRFASLPDRADLEPAHEALLLAEEFRELARPKSEKPPEDTRAAAMAGAFREADQFATALHESLSKLASAKSPAALKTANRQFEAVAKNCALCHARFRD